MAYKMISSDSQKIIFQRESLGYVMVIFLFIGFSLMVGSVFVNLLMEGWGYPFIIFKLIIPLFGILFISAGLYLPKQMRESSPEQIVFDNQKGAVLVQMTKDGAQTGIIRYDEIEGFDIYVEVVSSGKSTSYYYNTFLKKKDGGEWYLTRSGTQGKADVILNDLKAKVDLTKPFASVPSAKLSSKISKEEGAAKTVIHWKNKVSPWTPLFLLFFSVIFISILSLVFVNNDFDATAIFPIIIVGFIFLVFLLVMTIVVKKMIKDATTRYAISVDSIHLEYYEFSQSTGQMKNSRKLPLTEVKSINYSFSQEKANMNAGLKILTSNDIQQLQSQRDNPLTAFKDLFGGGNQQPITLSITALNPVECLQLESWLQELILKKGKITVA